MATALAAAAPLDSAGVTVASRSLPSALQRLVTAAPLLSHDGRMLSVSEAAERLEISPVTVYAWIESKRLLAWRAARRGVMVPAQQIIGPGEVVPGIERVLALIPDSAAAWNFLTEESPYVNADALRRPIDSLRAGHIDAVIAAARSFLDAFT